MKPNIYMPFFGNEFFMAVAGQSHAFVACYMRAIWFYWHHTSCRGLKNDKEFLRRICQADRDEWDELYDLIFDMNSGFFTLDGNDLWQQKRAQEEWEKASIRSEKAKSAAKSKWKNYHKQKPSSR
jgi:uncharacterized protein YdaU (DUF1376 family)